MSRLTACILAIGFAVALAGPSRAQDEGTQKAVASGKEGKQELLDLSKQKWLWMADRKVEELEALFHEQAVFVHMGGSMTRAQELEVIKSGDIQYEKAEIQDASVQVIGTTAILLNRIRLLAVVGGNEVTNPFMVTEVYVQQDGKWKLAYSET